MNTNYDINPDDIKRNENFEELLKEKYRRDEVEKYKSIIPRPGAKNNNLGSRKVMIAVGLTFLAGFLLLLIINGKFSSKGDYNDTKNMARELIASTIIPSKDDVVLRGEGANGNDTSQEWSSFYSAAELLRNGSEEDIKLAINQLENILTEKNPLYQETIWLKALGHLALGESYEAEKLLFELRKLSNYQNQNSDKILEIIGN